MDQKKQFLLLIGALILIIVLIILVPGPNFGQISLVNNAEQIANENILKDSTLALTGADWQLSSPTFQNTVSDGGLHTLTTDTTGLILTQPIAASLLTGKTRLLISGNLQSANERDTFFIALKDNQGREIYRNSVDPRQAFSLTKDLSITEQTFAANGLTLSIELPGSASYKVETVSLSVQ